MHAFQKAMKVSLPTSSAVVSDVQIKTSSDVGRDCELSCMYKDSTVPRMSSVIHIFDVKKINEHGRITVFTTS